MQGKADVLKSAEADIQGKADVLKSAEGDIYGKEHVDEGVKLTRLRVRVPAGAAGEFSSFSLRG